MTMRPSEPVTRPARGRRRHGAGAEAADEEAGLVVRPAEGERERGRLGVHRVGGEADRGDDQQVVRAAAAGCGRGGGCRAGGPRRATRAGVAPDGRRAPDDEHEVRRRVDGERRRDAERAHGECCQCRPDRAREVEGHRVQRDRGAELAPRDEVADQRRRCGRREGAPDSEHDGARDHDPDRRQPRRRARRGRR